MSNLETSKKVIYARTRGLHPELAFEPTHNFYQYDFRAQSLHLRWPLDVFLDYKKEKKWDVKVQKLAKTQEQSAILE